MAVGQSQLSPARPKRRRLRLRISVLGMLVLVALAACALVVYRYVLSDGDRQTLFAVYRDVSPVADGTIGANEYGPPLTITWSADNTLAAFEHDLTGDSTRNKSPQDLTVRLHIAYTKTSLFFAFNVRDQFVDAQEEDKDTPHQNDGVEIFIDGDRVVNDFQQVMKMDPALGPPGPSEGFQLLVNAAGHHATIAQDFSNAEWKRAVKRTGDGYIVEIEIPLALIDTQDGPGCKPPGPGSVINFALAVTDNDEEVRKQVSYAYLRTAKTPLSPWIGGESSWRFAIKLEPRWSLFSW
jgi:hypothetical protein